MVALAIDCVRLDRDAAPMAERGVICQLVNFRLLSEKWISMSSSVRPSVSGRIRNMAIKLYCQKEIIQLFSIHFVNSELCNYYVHLSIEKVTFHLPNDTK